LKWCAPIESAKVAVLVHTNDVPSARVSSYGLGVRASPSSASV
jgi:hypothetical protein